MKNSLVVWGIPGIILLNYMRITKQTIIRIPIEQLGFNEK